MLLPVLAILTYLLLSFRADTEPLSPVLEVKNLGRLRGTTLQSAFNNRSIHAFRGIPYGKPPVGPLRFRDPEPYGPWTGELDATKYGSCCIQTAKSSSADESEDCLFLNVYARPERANRPVMVYIHGGGWTTGCSSAYGPEYLLDDKDDVVLVTVNYRLGLFGFITTEDEHSPGNYGLMDQHLALRWVQDHIADFGGNPEAVTVFGQSAGAYAVHHHVLSPMSSGLFQRAILQSGTSLCPRALIEGGRATLLRHAKMLNYTAGSSADDPRGLLDFMAAKTASELIDTQAKLPSLIRTPISYGPRVAHPFLPGHPINLIKSGRHGNDIPLMIGMTQDEGALTAGGLLRNGSAALERLTADYRQLLPGLLEFHATATNPAEMADKIWKEYISINRTDPDIRGLSHMVGDRLYYHGIIQAIRLLEKDNHVQPLVYYLSRKPFNNSVRLTYGQFDGMDELGVAHTDDLFYLFPDSRLQKGGFFRPESEDGAMVGLTARLFTSFALANSIQHQPGYLELKSPPEWRTAGPLPFESRMPFWDGLNLDGLD